VGHLVGAGDGLDFGGDRVGVVGVEQRRDLPADEIDLGVL